MKYLLAVVALCLLAFPAFAQSPLTTTVADTIYAENGSPQTGSLIISNPRFTSPDGYAIAASTETVTLSSSGIFSIALVPTFGGTPAGTYYTIQINPSSGPPRTEQWSVPYFPTALTISQIIVTGPGTPIPPLSGDVIGSFITSQVVGMHFGTSSVSLALTAPINGDCLGYNSTTGQASFTYGCAGGGGSGVSSFSAQASLSPLFTTWVANSTTTPFLSFTLSSAAGNTIFGNCTGSSAAPSYCSLTSEMMPTGFCNTTGGVAGQVFESTGSGCGGYADPIVSGATAIGAAPSTNPVFVGTWDSSGNIRVPLTTNGTPGGSDYALETRIAGTLPAFALTPAFTISGTLPAFTSTPAFTISGTLPAFASTPLVNAAQSGTWTVQQGGAPWSVSGSGSFTVVQTTGTNLHMVCDSGCSSSAGFADNSAFTVGTTAITPVGALYSTSTPAISSGNAGRVRMDANSYLYTDCVVGCSGGATTPSDAFANPTTAGLSFSFLAGFNGTTWDRLRDDSNKYLYVDISNSSLAVTGTFWQTTQPVSLASLPALPSGSNVIGGVTQGGTWTVQPGNTANTTPWLVTAEMQAWNGSSWQNATPWPADNSAFTAGTTGVGIIAGWYASSPTACTSGNLCAPSLTSDRKLFVQSFQGTSPWVDSVTTWGGGTLGAMANYGTSPGAVLVPGVNAYITNSPTVTGSGNFTVVQSTGTNLHIVCDSGCSSSAGFADNSAFTVGTTAINPIGGLYDTGADPSISNGNAGRARIDSHSYLFSDLTALDGTVLGAPSNYGTSPGAVEVQGVNAYVTNTVPVSGTFWQSTQPVSGSGVFEVGPTGSANTVTNPFFFEVGNGTNNAGLNGTTYTSTYGLNANILGLDGAVFSATNALFGQISDGTNAMGAMVNLGAAESAVKALNANASIYQGTTAVGSGNPLQVTGANGTFPVTGTFWQTTQPVSCTLTNCAAQTAGLPESTSTYAATPYEVDALTSSATVKSSAGNVYGWYVYNPNASACFLEVFNTTSPTLGTTAPILSLAIPATSAANIPPGSIAVSNFSTAIAVAATTASKGSSACGTGMTVNLWYD